MTTYTALQLPQIIQHNFQKYKKMIEFLLTNILVISLAASMGSDRAYEMAKPGCPAECGGIEIPFPFGIGDGCYLNTNLSNDTYRINCNNGTNHPVPFLVSSKTMINSEVLSINVEDHTIRASSGVKYQCYENGRPVPSTIVNRPYRLQNLWPFHLSATKNRLVAIGCDTYAHVGDLDPSDKLEYVTGCTASCYPSENVTNGTCSGVGCCETSIIKNIEQPLIYVDSYNNHSGVEHHNPCDYAFVGEVGSHDFSSANLTATAKDCDKMRVPVVYDWSIALFESCLEARKAGNGTLICGPNAKCVDGNGDGWGYRCLCLKGYNGNPYLPQGCQDIDECLDPGLNDCEWNSFCVNTNGGYFCHCKEDYFKSGNGTVSNPCRYADQPDVSTVTGFIIVGSTMIFYTIIFGLHYTLERRKEVKRDEIKHNFKKNGGLLLQQQISADDDAINRTKIFSRTELEKATDNFNNNRVIGTGGQGTVYKGILADGTIVAVKKSKKVDEHQLVQFINEVAILSQINHRNVVKLFGCCLETEVPLLVYEFVPNGTLYQHIHHSTEDLQMTWKVRLQIAIECAGAIAYLHSSCSSPIYHRDIKSSNILLDEKYKSKVSDFGTSKTISIDKTHVTTCVQGTFGYLDPEFFRSNQFSEKSDVYSFGVLLLELITSKKPVFTNTSREHRGLATEFLQLMETSPNKFHDILDKEVLQNCSEEEIEGLSKLIKRCLNMNGKRRPTMREVAMTLEMIKSQTDEEASLAAELGEGNKGIDQIDIAIDRLSDTSSFNDTSYSMNLEPS